MQTMCFIDDLRRILFFVVCQEFFYT